MQIIQDDLLCLKICIGDIAELPIFNGLLCSKGKGDCMFIARLGLQMIKIDAPAVDAGWSTGFKAPGWNAKFF